MNNQPNTPLKAMQLSRLSCHDCGLLSHAQPGIPAQCPRCHATLHFRRPNSIARSWALLLAAVILYVPANLLPVMSVTRLGSGEPDTIISGVQQLIAGGMWPLALLVFFASIIVPMLKLIGLMYLLISVQRRSSWRPKQRTMLYRMVESIGRWSMIDIFVLSILVALVQLGNLATINPGAGASCFAGVVVITMFAATSFDPRLIWDVLEEQKNA